MGKVRSPVYSHYSEDRIKGLYSCLYCTKTISFSSGTSNMHKHLKIFHPDIDRYGSGNNSSGTIIYEGDYTVMEEEDASQVETSEEVATQVVQCQSPVKKRKLNAVRVKQEEVAYIEVDSPVVATTTTTSIPESRFDGKQVTLVSNRFNNSVSSLLRQSHEKDAPETDQTNHLGPRGSL